MNTLYCSPANEKYNQLFNFLLNELKSKNQNNQQSVLSFKITPIYASDIEDLKNANKPS